MSTCAPVINNYKNGEEGGEGEKGSTLLNSCYTEDMIRSMVAEYNKAVIEGGEQQGSFFENIKGTLTKRKSPRRPLISTNADPKTQLRLLRKYLRDEVPKTCQGEWCLAETPTLRTKRTDIKKHFRPSLPASWKKNPRTWLNTTDILHVLKQYETAFPTFELITVSPIDFDTRIRENGADMCVDQRLCTLSIPQLRARSKTQIGAVFNLDKHYQSGSHWTSMFVDVNQGEGYYFDSVAGDVPREVYELFKRIRTQVDEMVLAGTIQPFTYSNYEERLTLTATPHVDATGCFVAVPITTLVSFLLSDDNFVMYRYARFYADEVKKTCTVISHITPAITKQILSRVFELLDKTSDESYAQIDDLEEIMSRYGSVMGGKKKRASQIHELEQFAHEWVRGQLKLAICNLVEVLRILYCSETKKSYRVKHTSYDESSDTMRFYMDANRDDPLVTQQKAYTFHDVSFRSFKNYVQHQFKNTECGVYCINFIDTMLTRNKKFSKLIRNRVADDSVNRLRYTKYYTSYQG